MKESVYLNVIQRGPLIYLYREITNEISKKQPSWLSKTNVEILIPALLAGAWDGDFKGDKKVNRAA